MNSGTDVNIIEFIRVGGILTGLMILLATWVVNRVIGGAIARIGEQFADKRLLINQIATLVRFSIYLSGIVLAIIFSFQLSREVILAITGTAAVTIGFALKDLAASVLAGIIIIIDRPFQVGDRVNFGGHYGEIKEIGLRSVRMVTLDDNVVTIPNNKFLTDVVSSGNWGALDMLVQLDFFIGQDQNVTRAKDLVGQCLTSSPYAFRQKPWSVLINQVQLENCMAVRLRAKCYVLDVKYEKTLESDITERVIEAFNEYGIMPPAIIHRPGLPEAPGKSVPTASGA
jgi:small-conductance mechanosensitive channel